jgi:hypothetical protein
MVDMNFVHFGQIFASVGPRNIWSSFRYWRSMRTDCVATIAAGRLARVNRKDEKSSLNRFWLPGTFGSFACREMAFREDGMALSPLR